MPGSVAPLAYLIVRRAGAAAVRIRLLDRAYAPSYPAHRDELARANVSIAALGTHQGNAEGNNAAIDTAAEATRCTAGSAGGPETLRARILLGA